MPCYTHCINRDPPCSRIHSFFQLCKTESNFQGLISSSWDRSASMAQRRPLVPPSYKKQGVKIWSTIHWNMKLKFLWIIFFMLEVKAYGWMWIVLAFQQFISWSIRRVSEASGNCTYKKRKKKGRRGHGDRVLWEQNYAHQSWTQKWKRKKL